jgi:DNA-binding GntR family transcriptional regulator
MVVETDPERRSPQYVRLAEELEAEILRGRYRPGEALPTERALAAKRGVNRNTAAHALNHMQTRGLVYRVRGRGTFVSPGRLDYRVDRRPSSSAAIAKLGLRPSQRVLSIRKVRAHGRYAEELAVPEGEIIVTFERVRFAGDIPLGYGKDHCPEKLFPRLDEHLRKGCNSLQKLLKNRYGLETYRARTVFEIEPADPQTARDLGVSSGAPLLKVEALDVLEDGTPADWGVGYLRGDAARVHVAGYEPGGGNN